MQHNRQQVSAVSRPDQASRRIKVTLRQCGSLLTGPVLYSFPTKSVNARNAYSSNLPLSHSYSGVLYYASCELLHTKYDNMHGVAERVLYSSLTVLVLGLGGDRGHLELLELMFALIPSPGFALPQTPPALPAPVSPVVQVDGSSGAAFPAIGVSARALWENDTQQ